MSTPLQALDRALKDGRNASEVLASLTSQGFVLARQDDMVTAATEVFRHMHGVSNPEATAKTVVVATLLGSQIVGMLGE